MKRVVLTILLGAAGWVGAGGVSHAHEPVGVGGSVTVWRGPHGVRHPVGPPGMWPPVYGYRPYPGWPGPWVGGWAWGWGDVYPYPPPVVVPPPVVYIERPIEHATPPGGYWYWCTAPQGWYPTLRECPSGWQPVLPRPQ